MAQIDSSIALNVKAPQFENHANALARLLQVQGMQQDQQMGRLKVDEYQRSVADKNRLATLLGQTYAKPEEREDALLRGGFVDQASKLSKDRREGVRLDNESEKARLSASKEKLSIVGQILGSVRDQASYDRARETAQSHGIDVSKLPPVYDPALVEGKRQEALSVEHQLEQVWKQKGYDLEVKKVVETNRHNTTVEGETGRHNKSSEGLTARGQDITVRGQNMVDGRSREANALTREANATVYDADRGILVNKGTGVAREATVNGAPLGGKPEKLGEGAKKQVTGIDSLHSAIEEYKSELQNWGKTDALRPDKRAAMGTKYKNMMLQAKEAYNLGVLNGPDYEILTSVVTDPASIKGTITSNDALNKQATELDRMMQRTRAAVTNQGKGGGAPSAPAVATKTAQAGLSPEEQKELQQLRQRFKK